MEIKMTCIKITYNISLNKQKSSSQEKQQIISDELIQENLYHTNIRKQRHLKTEQSQQTKTSDIYMRTKSKEFENQTIKLENKENITYITENTEQNVSTGKKWKRVQNIAEIIETKVPVEMRNIKIKAKQQENDVIDNKASNNQK